jgi:hypothetical protein
MEELLEKHKTSHAKAQRPLCRQRGCWPQPKRDSLRPLCLSSLNTETTEDLSDLRVEALLTTEHTETLRTRGEVFAPDKKMKTSGAVRPIPATEQVL